MAQAVTVEGLSKSFGGLTALNNVDLTVSEGERHAVIGPNGAGKTTLLNLISGQLYPSSGRIRLFGHDVTGMPRHQRIGLGLARTYQLVNLFPNLTVSESIFLALQATRPFRFNMFRLASSYRDVGQEAEALLERWGLGDKRRAVVKSLSYGDQRILDLVLALASKPKLLLLDEPTNGLAEQEIAAFVAMIRQLGTDITLLLVAHDMDLVFDVAERITVLHNGEVISCGTKDEVRCAAIVRQVYLGADETQNAAIG